MKSAEAVSTEVFRKWQATRAAELGIPEYEQPELVAAFALALRAARAEVWEEAAKFVKKRLDRPEYTWLVEELRSRARLSEPPRLASDPKDPYSTGLTAEDILRANAEPPRGPGQGEEDL